jgi:predicted dehydrogenase
MNLQELKIGIVGSGNVAHHLALAIAKHPHLHLQAIHSRNENTGNDLAIACACAFENELQQLVNTCELIILCVADDAVSKIIQKLKLEIKY